MKMLLFHYERAQFVSYLCPVFAYLPLNPPCSALCVEMYWIALLSIAGLHLEWPVVAAGTVLVCAFASPD